MKPSNPKPPHLGDLNNGREWKVEVGSPALIIGGGLSDGHNRIVALHQVSGADACRNNANLDVGCFSSHRQAQKQDKSAASGASDSRHLSHYRLKFVHLGRGRHFKDKPPGLGLAGGIDLDP